MANQSFTYGTAKALTANAFTREGYEFLGWATSASSATVAYTDGQTVSNLTTTSGGTVNLYAVWRHVYFTVTVTKSETAGTLSLVQIADGVETTVATEADGTLSYSGPAGVTYRVDCAMGAEDVRWRAVGIAGLTNNSFVPAVDATLNYTFAFEAKTFHTVGFAYNEHGEGEVVTEPALYEDDVPMWEDGSAVTVRMTPNAGYKPTQAAVDEGDINRGLYTGLDAEGVNGEFTIEQLTFDATVRGVFAALSYSASASVDAPSAAAITAVTVSDGTPEYDDVVTFTATVDTQGGYLFDGWYLDGVKVSSESGYQRAITEDIALVAKAKVQFGFAINYAQTGSETCSLTVNGEAYAWDSMIDVILGDSVSFALTTGEGWFFDCWRDGDDNVLALNESGTVTPTESGGYEVTVQDSAEAVKKTINVYLKHFSSGQWETLDAEEYPGAVTINGVTTEAVQSGGTGLVISGSSESEPKPYTLTLDRTGYAQIAAVASLEIGGEDKAFHCFAWSDPLTEGANAQSEDPIITRQTSFTMLVADDKTLANDKAIYVYYGTAQNVTTTLDYCDGASANMGAVAITSSTDANAVFSENRRSVLSRQGTSIVLEAAPMAGYKFVGWYYNPGAVGSPLDVAGGVTVLAERPIYALFKQDANNVYRWEGSADNKLLTWRTKTYEASKPFNPSACRVDARGYPPSRILELTVDMYSAPDAKAQLVATTTLRNEQIPTQAARRLPVKRMERYMQVEVKSNVEVDTILVGTSMEGLAI